VRRGPEPSSIQRLSNINLQDRLSPAGFECR
jgi:hypothetical protein